MTAVNPSQTLAHYWSLTPEAALAQLQTRSSGLSSAEARREALHRRYAGWSGQGYRVLGLATKPVSADQRTFARENERDLIFNFLSDIPGMAIADDSVDRDWVERPRRWDIAFIHNFMIVFGLVSSIFDYATFGVLLFIARASPDEFRTGWFIESALTELAVALVVRTRQPFFRSRPGTLLWVSTVAVAGLTIALPYLPFNTLFDFVPLPLPLLLLVIGITGLYVLAAEVAKHFFYARVNGKQATR